LIYSNPDGLTADLQYRLSIQWIIGQLPSTSTDKMPELGDIR
jgi:hypothetical protein